MTASSLIDLRTNSIAIVADSPGKDEYQEQDAFKAKMLDALKAMKDFGRTNKKSCIVRPRFKF